MHLNAKHFHFHHPPVNIAGAEEWEDGCDDLDDVADGVEAPLDVTERVIPQQVPAQQRPGLSGLWQPVTVTLNGLSVHTVHVTTGVGVSRKEMMDMVDMPAEEITQWHGRDTHTVLRKLSPKVTLSWFWCWLSVKFEIFQMKYVPRETNLILQLK